MKTKRPWPKPHNSPEYLYANRDRFVSIIPITGCWMWMRSLSPSGYGQMWIDGRLQVVHRVLYEFLNGPIPHGMESDHLCRHRWCVNPSHIEAVTKRENIIRGMSPSGINARKTTCQKGHAYMPKVSNPNHRTCPICRPSNDVAKSAEGAL